MMQSDNIGELAEALAQAQSEISCPPRNRTVRVRAKSGASYDFAYTTLDAVIEAVRIPLTSNGLWFTQLLSNEYGQDGYVLRTQLLHSSGQWIHADTRIPIDEPGIQKLGSAITYMRRYALCAILGITAEEDDDANSADGNEVKAVADLPAANDNKPKAYEWTGGPEPKAIANTGFSAIQWSQLFLSAISKSIDIEGWFVANAATIDNINREAPAVYKRLMAQIDKRTAEIKASQQKTEIGSGSSPYPENPAADGLANLEAELAATNNKNQLNAVYASYQAKIRAGGESYRDAAVQLFLNNEKRLGAKKVA